MSDDSPDLLDVVRDQQVEIGRLRERLAMAEPDDETCNRRIQQQRKGAASALRRLAGIATRGFAVKEDHRAPYTRKRAVSDARSILRWLCDEGLL